MRRGTAATDGGTDPVRDGGEGLAAPECGGTAVAPLTPIECTLSGYNAILIDIPRLRQSDFDAITDDAAWRAGMNLWFSAWQSTPTGSLRSDDPALARAAGLGRDIKGWRRVKETALQGFVLCSDGRVYHRVLTEIALGLWIEKLIRRHAGQKGNRGDQTPEQRQEELQSIERLIGMGAHCLRALCPSAPALSKAAKFPQCAPQSVPQCGDGNGALRPQEKGREEKEVSIAPSGAENPDPSKTLFDVGVGLLTSKGKSESSARSFLALMQRDHGDAAVLDAINRSMTATNPTSAIRDKLQKGRRQAEYHGP